MKTKLVLFGITGDLSQRKLLPALREIVRYEHDIEIIGVSRREGNVEELVGAELAPATTLFTMDLAEPDDYQRLREFVDVQGDEQALIYLSVPPAATSQIVTLLGQAGLNTPNVKLLFEKPFGFDLESAKEYLASAATYFTDEQSYRIDHYAAKEVAQQLIAKQAQGGTWNATNVRGVEIVATETIGIEDRAAFYEQTGALRDFLQGHLLQLLALVLIDTSNDIPSGRLAALNLLQPADPTLTIRAQYEGYAQEVNNPQTRTETFVSMTLYSDDIRWQGVPLTLTSGKALDKKQSAVIIYTMDGSAEVLDEALVQPVDGRKVDAYERVIVDAMRGNKTIFTTAAEVLRAWEIVAPVQLSWTRSGQPLSTYTKGSSAESVSI